MKYEIAKELLKRLKSGKYQQTRGKLSNESRGRCCLGVVCEMYKEKVGGRWVTKAGVRRFFDKKGSYSHAVLTLPIEKWAGITEKQSSKLIQLNDETGKGLTNFKNVIPYLEKHIKDLERKRK